MQDRACELIRMIFLLGYINIDQMNSPSQHRKKSIQTFIVQVGNRHTCWLSYDSIVLVLLLQVAI